MSSTMIFSAESHAACTGPLLDGYDDCVAFALTDAPRFSVSSICDYRKAIGMTSSWDSVNEVLTIAIDPNTGFGIPAVRHPLHDGEWATLSDYMDAFYDLALGTGCSDEVEMKRPDICDPFPLKFVITDRPVWIDSSGISAHQDLNAFWGALSSDDGIINIYDTGVFDLLNAINNQCDTKSTTYNGNTFEVKQCSYYQASEQIEVVESLCESSRPHLIPWHHASTRFEYFKWNNLQTNFDYTSGTGVYRRLLIKADVARIQNDYYNVSAVYVDDDDVSKSDTPPFGVGRDGRHGVCGAGRVERIPFQPLYLWTFVGTAPNCFR